MGGNPRGAAGGEGLEEAFAALLADALSVLLSGGKHDANQKGRKRQGGSTLGSNANANKRKSEGASRLVKTTDLDAEDAEFLHSERSGAALEPQEASMVIEKREEPQKGLERGELTAAVQRTAIFRGFLKKSELEHGRSARSIVRSWICPCSMERVESTPIGVVPNFEIFWARGRALSVGESVWGGP
jgi:hypothetical protein